MKLLNSPSSKKELSKIKFSERSEKRVKENELKLIPKLLNNQSFG